MMRWIILLAESYLAVSGVCAGGRDGVGQVQMAIDPTRWPSSCARVEKHDCDTYSCLGNRPQTAEQRWLAGVIGR